MRKIHFMSAVLMIILVTSMGGLQQVSALMSTDVVPPGGQIDFYEVIDGSGSITQTVFDNQVLPALSNSLAAALADPNTHGIVRVTIIQFASSAVLECQVVINGPADITTLTDCINNDIAYLGGGTNIAAAYDLVTAELNASPFNSVLDRSIVDLFTDGNHGAADSLPDAFNAALAAGLDSSVVLGVEGNEVLIIAGLQALVFPNPPGQLFDPFDPINDVLPDPLVEGFLIIIDSFDELEDVLLAKLGIIEPPVGGELIPLDTTALLLAGAQTNAVWLLSALAVIGSVAFGAFYINSRKQ